MPPASRRLLVACACAALAACARQHEPARPGHGVLVIAIDALRADHVRCFGYDRATTPVLDELAAGGTAFLEVYTPSPELQGAHAALLTGTEPALAHRELGETDDPVAQLSEWSIPGAVPRLAREFLAAGYTTAAFVDHLGLSDVYGFGDGFQDFRCFAPDPRSTASIGYEAVASKLFVWLRERASEEDWFAYVHVNDLERLWEKGGTEERWDTFFEPRPALAAVPAVAQSERSFFAIPRPRWRGATRSLGEYEALYDGALRRLDTKFGLLFEELRKRGKLRNTTVVIVGAYGVGFGEAGLVLDSGTLADGDLHVPLIVRPAPILRCKAGTKNRELVSLMDLAPTLLELAGLEKPAGMAGVSHAAALRGETGAARPRAFASGGVHGGFAVLEPGWCFERILPAANGSAELARSWAGDDQVAPLRRTLHDHARGGGNGHLGADAGDPARAAAMERAGQDWYAAVARARDLLQGKLDPQELTPVELADLRGRGLLGEAP